MRNHLFDVWPAAEAAVDGTDFRIYDHGVVFGEEVSASNHGLIWAILQAHSWRLNICIRPDDV